MIKRIGITGAAGQLGFVARARLQFHHAMEVIPAERQTFANPRSLAAFVSQCDVIVHLAGINRGSDEEIENGNRKLAEALVQSCRQAKAKPAIVFSSSIHRDRDTPYGRAKRQCADILEEFCRSADTQFTEIVFPNLFGEFSRPFYNNFVGTFCHQISSGQEPTIDQDTEIELLHYVDAADTIAQAITVGVSGVMRPTGVTSRVGKIAALIKDFHGEYATGTVPDLRDPFKLKLFNTYRAYVFPQIYPVALTRHVDNRGSFFECVRAKNRGQVSFSTTLPRITRGNHFHFQKIERFLVISGTARISVRKLYSNETRQFDVIGQDPCFIDMPTMHTHNITNTGSDELLTLFWTNEFFEPKNPDTYSEPV